MSCFFTFHRISTLLMLAVPLLVLPGPAPTASLPVNTTAATPLPAAFPWGWPLAGRPMVARGFDPPAQQWLSGHRGVDLMATQGAAVVAPTNAVVSFAGVVVNREVLTLIEPGGLRLSFEPVNSTLRAGDTVIRGQTIGVVQGPTHCNNSPADSCLHWGVRRGETYLDPLQFILDLRPSVLLPLR